MEYRILGRTGIKVSLAGLGCGGPSRLGLGRGYSSGEAAGLVRHAIDLGVTLIDTSPAYGTEEIVGEAIAGRRDGLVLSTKVPLASHGGNGLSTGGDLLQTLQNSLSLLRTDHLDILLLHGVSAEVYAHCVSALLPCLEQLKAQGTIRCFGLSEAYESDPREHRVLQLALDDGCWDCMMVGFSLANPSALDAVLPRARTANAGILVMRPARDVLAAMPPGLSPGVPGGGQVESAVDRAYRYCGGLDGVHSVLTGTGSKLHLEANVTSICAPSRQAGTAPTLCHE